MNRRVLIVEDEFIVADDLESQLKQLGCEVVGIAASGDEALALADQKRPGIVLMDVQLEGEMSGIDAAEIIHRKTGAAVIFITAFAAVFLRNPSRMQPPGICLSKPFSTVQLKIALEAVLPETVMH